jgi:hypothetical protein
LAEVLGQPAEVVFDRAEVRAGSLPSASVRQPVTEVLVLDGLEQHLQDQRLERFG